jgi:hypothetical protein
MTPRQIRDANGELWIVWQVTPPMRPRRDADTEPIPISWDHRVTIPETQRPGYSDGWLAFKSATERRRLTPFPKAWEWRSDEELLDLLEQAAPADAT